MNIYAKHGDNVIFDNPTYGHTYDQNLAKEHLTIGNVYTVEKTIVYSSRTKVFLVEAPKVSFNSVLFSDIAKKKTYEEVTKKFESVYWPDGLEENILDPSKWREAEKEFKEFLNGSGWTRDSWMNEQCKRFIEK